MLKRTISLFLAFVLVVTQLLTGVVPVLAASTVQMTDHSFNGEGLWITEIYNNDVDRSEKNNTRDSNGYLPVELFESASDLMEFVELCSTHDVDIQFQDLYELYIDEIRMTVTDAVGNTDITLSKGQRVVVWNYRTDIKCPPNSSFALPCAFRRMRWCSG